MFDPKAVFADHQLRCTRQRIEVFSALASTKSHPNAEQLHRMVQCSSPGTSLATVYNTLEALCEAGLCRRIATTEGGLRYDADVSDHLHAVSKNGDVIDVPTDLGGEVLASLPPDLLARLEQRLGTGVGHLHIQLSAREASPPMC